MSLSDNYNSGQFWPIRAFILLSGAAVIGRFEPGQYVGQINSYNGGLSGSLGRLYLPLHLNVACAPALVDFYKLQFHPTYIDFLPHAITAEMGLIDEIKEAYKKYLLENVCPPLVAVSVSEK